jgi:hypothetical protein
MLRAAEIGLFLLPIGLFVLWRVLTPHVRPALLWAALAGVLVLGGAAIGYGLNQRLDRGERYVPAQLVGGRIVGGHGVK